MPESSQARPVRSRFRAALEMIVVSAVAVAAVVAGAAVNEENAPRVGKPGGKRTVVEGVKTKSGWILTNKRGRPLYAFTRDGRGASQCYGRCAAAWPPFIVHGTLLDKKGAKDRLVGNVRRREGGRQVTYAGRPLYFHAGDRKAGQLLGRGTSEFGGRWFPVGRGGKPRG
jgi:predicted lipoprotein with Yx(FWY)xxD motif